MLMVLILYNVCGYIHDYIIEIKATEQYFAVLLFIMLYKVVQMFESVDKILKGDQVNERLLWCCLLCCARWIYLFSLDETITYDHSTESY